MVRIEKFLLSPPYLRRLTPSDNVRPQRMLTGSTTTRTAGSTTAATTRSTAHLHPFFNHTFNKIEILPFGNKYRHGIFSFLTKVPTYNFG